MNTIKLPNGRTAISFVPEDSKDLGIVHISTIKRLAKLCNRAHPKAIINDLISELNDICSSNFDWPLEHAVTTCNEFTAFHETINLIIAYDPQTTAEKDALAGIDRGIKEANEMIKADLNQS